MDKILMAAPPPVPPGSSARSGRPAPAFWRYRDRPRRPHPGGCGRRYPKGCPPRHRPTDEENLLKEIYVLAKEISEKRKDISNKFEQQVLKQLSDLGMKNSKFVVEFNDFPSMETIEDKLSQNGCDDVRFLFSANAGQSLKPLSEIISGGEASRFMLGLKNILAENDNISSMVFDEIDTGISGDMGYKVACKLANIAKNHQVMSVSHLPQICAMADNNIKITKYVVDSDTMVNATCLDEEGCLDEISRLSGGKARLPA